MRVSRRLLVVMVVMALLVAACGANTSMPGNQDFLEGISGDAVLEATVLATFERLPAMPQRSGQKVRVERVLWDANGAAVQGSEIETRNVFHPVFEPGNRYLLFLSYFPGDPVEWSVKFATDLEGNPVPGYDTPDTLESLDRLLFPGETKADLIDALVEFSKERNAWLAAEGRAQASLPQTGRRSRHWLGDQAIDPLSSFVDRWTSNPPDRRYLPLDISEIPNGAEEALGMIFVPYEIVVIDNDAALADIDSLALRFPGVGILGNFVVDHDTGVTTIAGWAPEGLIATLEATGTAPGTPKALGNIDPAHRRGPIDSNQDGVYAVVTIEAGTVDVRVVGQDEYDQTIAELQDRIESAQPSQP